VAGLNKLMRSQPSPLYNWISNSNKCINNACFQGAFIMSGIYTILEHCQSILKTCIVNTFIAVGDPVIKRGGLGSH
jgi:hypothetical protein